MLMVKTCNVVDCGFNNMFWTVFLDFFNLYAFLKLSGVNQETGSHEKIQFLQQPGFVSLLTPNDFSFSVKSNLI